MVSKYAESLPWASIALISFLGEQILIAFGTFCTLTGSTKLHPRYFFSICVIGLPLLTVGTFCYILASDTRVEKYYNRKKWHIVFFICCTILSFIPTTLLAFNHVIHHGSDVRLEPFEMMNDVGTTTLTLNMSTFAMSLILIWITLGTIHAYTFDIFKTQSVMIQKQSYFCKVN
jgi:hypothetical protein